MLSSLRVRVPASRRTIQVQQVKRLITRPCLEVLEDRIAPSITIKIDYSRDTNGFFTQHADRQTLLQTAANVIASRLNDNLAAIVPSGGNSWTISFSDPSTGSSVTLPGPTIGPNTILVFAGARELGGSTIGRGGYGGTGWNGSQAWGNTVRARGQAGALGRPDPDRSGPWGGSITFNPNFSRWFFGLKHSGMASNQVDFLSVAEHESGDISSASEPQTRGITAFPVPSSPVRRPCRNMVVTCRWTYLARPGTIGRMERLIGVFKQDMDPVIANGKRTSFTTLDFPAGL